MPDIEPEAAPDAVREPETVREPVAVSEAEREPETVPGAVAEEAVVPDAVPEPEAGAVPGAVPVAGSRPPRRKLRAALRWTSAVLVFAALGGATAYAVTQPERTRIPGLKTPDDGRWTYPPYSLPKLPEGRPRPLADANLAGRHYADVRSLLLPPPVGTEADPAVPGKEGWLSPAAFVDLYDIGDPDLVENQVELLRKDGLRHIAARSWTTPDGTRTDIYLLQFISVGYVDSYTSNLEALRPRVAKDSEPDKTVRFEAVKAFGERPPYGPTAARYAYIYYGDTVALVVQTRKGSVAEVPFRQTVGLQAQLLG
ncbi:MULTISPECIES: hypothetical protein [unclassified Streptomyces]|uniref:hypothetical protein n=1 Tax=unclassified Streptomyces TaxID=2593676 RepID=UPI002E2D41B7|nr:hypothetical protein [Streptomyces sp. NBC_00223]